jgi:hypothetical protein
MGKRYTEQDSTIRKPTNEEFEYGNSNVIKMIQRIADNVPQQKEDIEIIIANLRICEQDFKNGKDVTVAYTILLMNCDLIARKCIVGFNGF